MTTQATKKFIESTVASHQIVVFAKSWCGYCDRTKVLLTSPRFQNVDVKFYDLEHMMSDHGPEIQHELAVQTGRRTVPSVWVNGSFLGGNDETQKAYRTGQLTALLQELQ